MFAQRVSNPRMLVLGIALLMVAGLGALQSLPRTEDPFISNRHASIITAFPGADAERVEALVTEKIENKLREIAEISHITSSSRPGLSVVTIQLQDAIYDTEPVMARARDKLNDLVPQLPAGVQVPVFDDDRGWAFTLITAISWREGGEQGLNPLGRYAQELDNRFRNLPGTQHVDQFGEPVEEFLVSVDLPEANALGLTLAELSQGIRQADAKVAAGQLFHQRFQWQIEVTGALNSAERIRQIPLRSAASGQMVRLGDIALVERHVKRPVGEMAVIHGADAVVVAAQIRPDTRIDTWTVHAMALLEQFQSELPANVKAEVIFSQSHYTEHRLAELMGNITLGFAIIFIVLLLTLGWRAALIVASSLPLTVCFTLFNMQLLGVPIHQMSVTGLVVALGIMVDNAIVIIDAVAHERRQGKTPLQAVADTVQHFWVPLLGSTLTTVLAFMPIVLMPGAGGEFVGPISITVILSLVGSYLISHTLIAGLGGIFLPAREEGKKHWYHHGIELPLVSDKFASSLRWSIANPGKSVAAVFALSLTGFFGGQTLTEQFFPPADRDMFHIEVYLPAHSSIAATRQLTDQISDRVRAQPGIKDVHWFIGNSAPSFYYNLMANRDGMPQYAQAMVAAEDYRAANGAIDALQAKLDAEFTGAQILVRKLDQGPPFQAPVELRVYGPNLATLKIFGEQLRQVLSETPGVLHTRSTLGAALPKIWLDVREEEARLAGLSLQDIAGQLQVALGGVRGGSIVETTEEIPVRLRVGDEERGKFRNVGSGQILGAAADGRMHSIPISALSDLRLTPSQSNITRRDGQRINTIEAYIVADLLPELVLQDFRERLAALDMVLPAGYSLEIGGESASRNDAMGNLMMYISVMVVLLVVVVVLTFNSFRLSAIVFMVAFQAVCMGLLSVFLAGYDFGFIVIIALMGLMGLAINAAIVILAELRTSAEAMAGSEEGIFIAVMSCTRHITSTTITTIGGFFPLVIDSSTFWPPFAVAMAGGTLLTTLLSFYFVPAAFRIAMGLGPAGRPVEVLAAGS